MFDAFLKAFHSILYRPFSTLIGFQTDVEHVICYREREQRAEYFKEFKRNKSIFLTIHLVDEDNSFRFLRTYFKNPLLQLNKTKFQMRQNAF